MDWTEHNYEQFSRIVLKRMMRERGIIPSQGQKQIRDRIFKDLEVIIKKWITEVGFIKGIQNPTALLIPYGSYGLQVYNGSSDMDLLVVAPAFASMESDFFVHLRDLIQTIPNLRNMRSIRKAIVPLLKFNILGVDVDVACACLQTSTVPGVEILYRHDFGVSIAADRPSRLALESVKSNWTILQCVQANTENFVQAIRFLKYWATRRGIYGNINGYIGGVHLVVLVAYVCKFCPCKSFAGIISNFFATFYQWNWAEAVALQGNAAYMSHDLLMLIQKPGTDHFCSSNVTEVTLKRICDELKRGFELTQILSYHWSSLLDEFPYEDVYRRFIKVRMSVTDDDDVDGWMGFVKSRLLVLLQSLDAIGIGCDPTVTEYRDTPPNGESRDNNRVFFWGIINDTGKMYNLTGPQENWRRCLESNNDGLTGQVKLAVIPRKTYIYYKRYNKV